MKKKILVLLSSLTPVLLVLFFSLNPMDNTKATADYTGGCHWDSNYCDFPEWDSYCVNVGANTNAPCNCGTPHRPCGVSSDSALPDDNELGE